MSDINTVKRNKNNLIQDLEKFDNSVNKCITNYKNIIEDNNDVAKNINSDDISLFLYDYLNTTIKSLNGKISSFNGKLNGIKSSVDDMASTKISQFNYEISKLEKEEANQNN